MSLDTSHVKGRIVVVLDRYAEYQPEDVIDCALKVGAHEIRGGRVHYRIVLPGQTSISYLDGLRLRTQFDRSRQESYKRQAQQYKEPPPHFNEAEQMRGYVKIDGVWYYTGDATS